MSEIPDEGHLIQPGSGYVTLAVLLVIAGAVLLAFGLHEAFTYDEASKLVGGDAFNFQIFATRGVVLVCSGLSCIAAAIVFAVLSLRAYLGMILRCK